MPGFGVTVPSVLERTLLVTCVLLLTAGAWMALWMTGESAFGAHHHHLGPMTGGFAKGFLLFATGWTIMTLAMMLPTALPILRIFHNFAAQRSDRVMLVGLAISGYLIIWIFFGGLVFSAAYLLKSAFHGFLSQTHAKFWAPAVILVAGIFQFTPLKYRCLDKCRSPFSFVMEYWQGRKHRQLAFRLGIDHGVFCVGCCWALMMLMFVVGFESLAWMFVLAAIMAIEKNVSWGRKISAPVGFALIGWSVLMTAKMLL